MNKDNFLKHVRNMCDLQSLDYTFVGKTFSDCTELHIDGAYVKFAEHVYVGRLPHTIYQHTYEEFAEVYSSLVRILFGSTVSFNNAALVMKASVGAFYSFEFEESGEHIIIDLNKYFPGKLEALRFLVQFLPRPDFDGNLSNDIYIDNLAFSFKFKIE